MVLEMALVITDIEPPRNEKNRKPVRKNILDSFRILLVIMTSLICFNLWDNPTKNIK